MGETMVKVKIFPLVSLETGLDGVVCIAKNSYRPLSHPQTDIVTAQIKGLGPGSLI